MKPFILLPFILLFSVFLYSNDSRVINFGNTVLLDESKTNIQIIEETLDFYLHKDSFDTVVNYVYANNNENDEEILLGFPIIATMQGNDLEKITVTNFKTIFNGEVISNFTQKTEQTTDDYIYYRIKKWYIRKIQFQGNTLNYSTVSYSSSYSYSGFSEFAEYITGTANNWNGSIKKISITVHIDKDVIIQNWKIPTIKRTLINATLKCIPDGYKISFEDYFPKENDEITFETIQFTPLKDYHNEFGNFYEGWIWDKVLLYNESEDEKLLYTKEQIQLFINFFYAMHGYPFSTRALKEYFVNNPSIFSDGNQEKYVENRYFHENMFNNIEKRNIQYLRRMLDYYKKN